MRFRVHGIPQQQGSKTAFVIGKRAIMKDANEKALKPWREQVAKTAGEAWGDNPVLLGPVKVKVIFAFPRPKSHYGSGRNATVLKESAPDWKTSTPDLDKLARAIGDALSGVVFKDDSQVAMWNVAKLYADEPYADITIIDLSGGSHDTDGSSHLAERPDPSEHRARSDSALPLTA